jgi:outer membrane scaffolding protein for murein synthesis (MipA/OmpV family)
MQRTLSPLLGALLGLTLACGPAMAQTATPAPAKPQADTMGLGFLAVSEWRAYKGVGNATSLFPVLQYENAWLDIWGPVADIKLHDEGPLLAVLRARYIDSGYDASDSPALTGMQDRKNSVWLGTKLQWRTSVAHLTAEWLADGSRHSKGQQLNLKAETLLNAGPVRIVPRVGLQWLDAKAVDYYYGVRTSESRAGRAAYQGSSAVNPEIGARFLYNITPSQSTFVDVSATALGSSIKRSPIVERTWVPTLRLGYVYGF